MDYLLGIKGKDFVLLAADASYARSILRMKSDYNKSLQLSEHCFSVLSGPVGDCVNFGEYIARNLKLNELRNGYEASPWATANYVRRNLADSLRSQGAYQVNLLLAGYDAQEGPQLYYMDYLAAMVSIPFGAHGYGGMFTLSTLDRNWREDLSLDEALVLMAKCIEEVRTRGVVGFPQFTVGVVDKDGVREVQLPA